MADAYREVTQIRPNLDELESLLEQLDAQARNFRASRLTADARPPR